VASTAKSALEVDVVTSIFSLPERSIERISLVILKEAIEGKPIANLEYINNDEYNTY
jgi:hypothetical protein